MKCTCDQISKRLGVRKGGEGKSLPRIDAESGRRAAALARFGSGLEVASPVVAARRHMAYGGCKIERCVWMLAKLRLKRKRGLIHLFSRTAAGPVYQATAAHIPRAHPNSHFGPLEAQSSDLFVYSS